MTGPDGAAHNAKIRYFEENVLLEGEKEVIPFRPAELIVPYFLHIAEVDVCGSSKVLVYVHLGHKPVTLIHGVRYLGT